VGVGLWIRRDGGELAGRLGLFRPTYRQLIAGTSAIAVLVVFQFIFGALWAVTNPDEAGSIEELNTLLLGNIDTVGEWLLLAASAGIGEEVLFRGALQPAFGLPFTALLFAVAHIQYGFSPATVLVFLLGAVLGIIRQRTNTTVAIYVHFGYNFILGLLALLAQALEPLVR
jgi:membrane protease YdiL (CAAX protease family)